MGRPHRRFAISAATATVLALIFSRPGIASEAATVANQGQLGRATIAAIDNLFRVPPHSPGYAVGIIKNGRFIYEKGFGLANLDDEVPIGADTSFHLASLSKQFTAAAIALMILEQKIALDDPVSKYIPDVARLDPDLRIEHLIYMTSGLPEYSEIPRAGGTPWVTFHYFTRDEAIDAVLKTGKLQFSPGTHWAYRNINYMLLTKIVEAVSNRSFAEYMRQQIFAPLGMAHTEIDDDSTEIIPHRATGYAPRSDPHLISELESVGIRINPGVGWARLVRVSPHFGGSGVFTTLNDLLLWDRNWYSGALHGIAFTDLMNRRQKFDHDKDNDAFGLVWRSRYNRPMLDYSGADIDSSTYMARFPDQHLTVICLSNMPLGDAEEKAAALMDVMHGAGNL